MSELWTSPKAGPFPSAHLAGFAENDVIQTRCGRLRLATIDQEDAFTFEPPATGRTCESCLRLANRDHREDDGSNVVGTGAVTFAPATLVALGRFWTAHGGVNLGVVGDTAHQSKGVSYHLGASDLVAGAYSAVTPRDRAGLTNAASAIDLGRLDGSLVKLRAFSRWFVLQAQADVLGSSDIREIIYSPDGQVVLRWDHERGFASAPRSGEADASHLAHTHLSFYRDSELRSKVALFEPYFAPSEVDHMLTPSLDPSEFRPLTGIKVKAGAYVRQSPLASAKGIKLPNDATLPLYGNANASTAWRGVLIGVPATVTSGSFYADTKSRPTIAYIAGTDVGDTVQLPIPLPDCTAAVAEAVKPLHDEIVNVRTDVTEIRGILTDLSERVDKALVALT